MSFSLIQTTANITGDSLGIKELWKQKRIVSPLLTSKILRYFREKSATSVGNENIGYGTSMLDIKAIIFTLIFLKNIPVRFG